MAKNKKKMKISQYLNIPQKMYDERKKAKLSQTYLAKKIGISQQSYSRYEKSIAEPSIETLEIFCKEVNISLPEFIGINSK